MSTRLPLFKIFPDLRKIYDELDNAVKSSGVPPLYLELVKIRASQLNGCAYCLDKHTQDAIKQGEDPRKLFVISAWHEAPEWFNAEEMAILQLTEEITMIGKHGISEGVYAQTVSLFGEEKTAFLIMAAISINSWNRIGVGLNMHPKK